MNELELVTPRRSRWRTATGPTVVGTVRVGTAVMGSTIRLTVELASGRADAHFVAAFLRVDFADPAVTATELRVDGLSESDEHRAGAEAVSTSVSVLRGGMYGWLLGDPLGSVPIPRAFTAHTLLSVPSGTTALTVTARLDATLLRTGRRRSHVRSRVPVEFVVPLPDVAPSDTGSGPAVAAPVRRAGTVRLSMAADIERFSRFHTAEAVRAQQRFVDVLAEARRYAEIDETAVRLQESGDGQFAVLPSGMDESTVVPRLIEGLCIALAHVNSDLNEHARLRLRVALHRGHIAPGANGWVGESSIAIHRILNSEAVRTALAATTSADFALIIPEVLYREVVCQRSGWLDPDEFVQAEVSVPAKGFTAPAWVHVPRR